MKAIDNYISEKLHLNKDMHSYIPNVTDSDEVFAINNIMKANPYLVSAAKKYKKDKDTVLTKYIAGLKVSGSSSPIIINNKIYSQPFNWFWPFGQRALELGWEIDEIQQLYERTDERAKDIKVCGFANDNNKLKLSFLCGLIDGSSKNSRGIPKFTKEPIYNYDWTTSFKKETDKIDVTRLNPISCIVNINGNEHIIETIITSIGQRYFGFWLDGKKYSSYNELTEAIHNL